MSIVSVSEQFQPNRYLVVSLRSEEGTISRTNIVVSNRLDNQISLITVERGPQGEQGSIGPVGPAGKDGLIFSVLPIASGGTNNTIFNSGYLLAYDGDKLASTSHTIQDIIDLAGANTSAITGIIAGTGLQKTSVNNTAVLDIQIGEGLTVSNNQIIVDNTIARTSELSLGAISGIVPISKGGTNNSLFNLNQLVYYNGLRLTSLPLNTGSIVISGSSVTIEAGSGLIGGGSLSVPNGSVVLQIAASADILVEENSISLSTTGSPGTYSKVITDSKGRVVSGTNLTALDILGILGYTPWHPGNDGSGSTLDADLLDGQHGSFYRNATNLSGTLPLDRLPDLFPSGDQYGTKFRINTKGLIDGVYYASSDDIIDSLGYRPLDATADDLMGGNLTIAGNLAVSGSDVNFYDNLPLFGTNSRNILPSEPRGFTFQYGSTVANKTGILAYYPTDNQLRLITNIFGSGAVLDVDGNGNSFDDDINGGSASTIYITENLQGDRLTVLFRELADQLYINTNQTQTIDALKKFLKGIDVVGQIKFLSDGTPYTNPPFNLAGNSLKVANLNSDLLDDQDGSYYRNAANITGNFSYNNVSFDHIAGDNNYIPKFNDTTSPARKINSSNIKQRTDGDIEVTNDVNFVVGEDNTIGVGGISNIVGGTNNIIESENSLAIGNNNKVYSTESAAIGSDNIASGINSIAFNEGSITKGKNSVALGSYGLSTLENQMSFGAFRKTTGNTILEHGQYSTIAAYLQGVETQGGWVSMSPTISLPREKTIAYNIELLMNKGLSSGVAHFVFSSGIINNATYRDPNNISSIVNSTTVPNSGSKTESYNNSQIRRHTHKWIYTNLENGTATNKTQYVWSKAPPAENLAVDLRYVHPYYFYQPEKVITTGTFSKNHNGELILDIHKPRYFESFYQQPFNQNIFIETLKPHNTTPGSLVEVNFTSGSIFLPISGRYPVRGVINDNVFAIAGPTWKAVKYNLPSGTRLLFNAPTGYDSYLSFNLSGSINNTTIYYNNNFTNNYNYTLNKFIKPNTIIKIQYTNNNITSTYHRVVTGLISGAILVNSPIKTTNIIPSIINGPIKIIIDDYSAHLFKICDRVFVNSESINISGAHTRPNPLYKPEPNYSFVNDGGGGDINNIVLPILSTYQNSGFKYSTDIYGNSSFELILSNRMDNIPDNTIVDVSPLFDSNNGLVDYYAKTDLACSYTSTLSDINVHTGVYTRYVDRNTGYQELRIFDTNYKPLDFISYPLKYELVDGPLSDYNSYFTIVENKTRSFLKIVKPLDFETSNIVPVRIKCIPQNLEYTDPYEQVVYIYTQDVPESPISNLSLASTGIVIDNVFTYTLPNNLFVDSDSNVLIYNAEVRGGYSLPRWLSFDNSSLTLSGIPDQCDIGVYSIDIKATDPGGLYGYANLIIEVSDNNISQSTVLASGIKDLLRITNITLSNNKIIENTSGIIIGEISTNGGYNPYIDFGPASNSVSGIFVENSDLFRNAQSTKQVFPNIVTISGSPNKFDIGSKVSAKRLNISSLNLSLEDNTKVVKTYQPTVFSGTPLSGNRIIFDQPSIPYSDFAIFTGQYLNPKNITDNFGINLRAKYIEDYGLTIGQALIQESFGLITTEDNEAIGHEISMPLITYHIEKESNTYDLLIETNTNTENYLMYEYPIYNSVTWAKNNLLSKLYEENFVTNLTDSDNNVIVSDNITNFLYLDYPPTFLDIDLQTENNIALIGEDEDKLSATIIDERIWYSNNSYRIRRNIRENINLSGITTLPINNLEALNCPVISDKEYVYLSNIDYSREDLNNPHDSWTFLEEVNNPVLYVNNIGSEDLTHFITEDRNYSGIFYASSPYEYGLLSTEDSDGLIPENDYDHGSHIELSNRYELLDSINVYANNGKLFSESELDQLLCESNDKLVHDYAIVARTGSAYILFPGSIGQIKLNYPKTRSFSASRLQNNSLGYFEDNLLLTPNNLSFTEDDFYFTWGKLIPYYLYTDEYAIRLNKPYSKTTTSGILFYSGITPSDGNYFAEDLLSNVSITQSGSCSVAITTGTINGISVSGGDIGAAYSTGIVTFYTSFAANNIVITSNIDFNKDLRSDDYVYLYNPSSTNNNPLLPTVDTYNDIIAATPNSITIQNLFLYPSSRTVVHNGNIKLNLDRNHEQIIKSSSYVNRIPIKFNSVYNTSQNRLPKNYLFDVVNITGHKIKVNDNQRYLLPTDQYFDGLISGIYTTNGCQFSGSLFHDSNTIYDVRNLSQPYTSIYPNITFEYNSSSGLLSINVPRGLINIFDNIKLGNFQPLLPSMVWNPNISYHTGFKVFPENLSVRKIDDTIDKDFILMERSVSILQPENAERLTFKTNIFNNSISGTCVLDLNLINRLENGYLLNYNQNPSQKSTALIGSMSGYSFSGIIPRFNNVISTTGTLNDSRIGFASIFNTGSLALSNGIKTIRRATNTDIGYSEFYHISSTGFPNHINNRPYSGIKGIGSSDRWYNSDIITTSESNKTLQFLYLGDEQNVIRISGYLNTPVQSTGFLNITKISSAEQSHIEFLASLGEISGVLPIFTTGNSSSGDFDISINVNKLDSIRIDLMNLHSTLFSRMKISLYAVSGVSVPALVLDSATPIYTGNVFYPRPVDVANNLFHVLPSLNLADKYCNTGIAYNKNNNIYYNGNLILINNLTSIKSYALENDQLLINNFNNINIGSGYSRYFQKINPSNEYYSITGISLEGSISIPSSNSPYRYDRLKENLNRNNLSFGTGYGFLPNTGTISFIPYYSGTLQLINKNNIYVQSYGGYTSRWPQDIDGVLTAKALTGTYSIDTNNRTCYSNKLCITINSYLKSSFSSLSTGNIYFFDFDSDASSISNAYRITDFIDSDTISITTDYNPNIIGASGLVYIIPSKYNIKTNLNPNTDNSFYSIAPSLSLNTQLVEDTIHYYDHETKKWSHMYHLTDSLSKYSGYALKFNNTDSTIIYNTKETIGINNISLYNATNNSFENINQNFTVYSDSLSDILRISTTGGSPMLLSPFTKNMPKVYIAGLTSYRTIIDSPVLYNYRANSGWDIGVEIIPFGKTGIYPINIKTRDETGQSARSINMVVKDRPLVKTTYPTGYFTVADSEWFLNFDTQGLDLLNDFPGNQGIFISGSPNDLSYDIDIRDASTLSVQGYRLGGNGGTTPFNTGIWNPVIRFIDINTSQLIASSTGTIKILNSLNDRPAFIPSINKFKNHYYVNIAQLENLQFYIPAYEQVSAPTIYFSAYGITSTISVGWDSDTNRYIATVIPKNTGDNSYLSETKYISSAQLSYSINQYFYNNGSQSTVNYNSENYICALTFYRPLIANHGYNANINSQFEMDQPWSYEFALEEGITKHRPDTPPRVKVYDTPNIGDSTITDHSCKIRYRYNDTDNYWVVLIEGRPDIYGRYAVNTGTYTIKYTADDNITTPITGSFNITYKYSKDISYIQSNIYTTPNNEFFINADIYDPASGIKIQNSVTFQGENSLSITNDKADMKFDNNLNIWEYYATGNKLLDKWDARLLIDTSTPPSLTLQCKGISSDKITAVAKVNLLELQNNNIDILEGLPIKITGLSGGSDPNKPFTLQSGFIIEQGSPWDITFKTVFGLASPQNPPTIILSGMPTTCSGYYPILDPDYNTDLPGNTQLARCITKPVFNENEKSWRFRFSGDASCLMSGEFPFSILAIDTNLNNNPIYIEPSDTVSTLFTYVPIQQQHPAPIIGQGTPPQHIIKTSIQPFCSDYYNAYVFGPSVRAICPAPTGLSGIITSGSLPTGLTFTISYTGIEGNVFNAPFFNNLSSGTLTIAGNVNYYPPSGLSDYPDKFYLTVVDARGLSTTQQISFSTSISPINPNIYFRIYFENDRPVFTDNTGTKPITLNPLYYFQPAASILETVCYSNIPNNKNCTKFPVIYSGAPNNATDYIVLLPVSGYNTNTQYKALTQNKHIYFNILDSNLYDGDYYIKKATNLAGLPDHISLNDIYINTHQSITTPVTGFADVIIEEGKIGTIGDFGGLFGNDNVTMISSGCYMGNGRVGLAGDGKYGLVGFMAPSYSGYIPTNGSFNSNDYYGTGLSYNIIDNTSLYSEVKYVTCQETGFLRFSGVALPKIYIEITDPPPLANRSYGDDGTTFSLNSKLAYGETEVQRNKPQNERSGNAYYTITNILTENIIQSGNVSIVPQNSAPIRLTASTLSTSASGQGTVFRLDYSCQGSKFPTADVGAIPTAVPSLYSWIHRAGLLGDIPSESSFPPVVVSYPKVFNIVSGELINYNTLNGQYGIRGLALGGYIPTDICIGGNCPQGYSNYPYLLSISGNNNSVWSSTTYIPKISGLILNTGIISRKSNNSGIPDSTITNGSYAGSLNKLLIRNDWLSNLNNGNGTNINTLFTIDNLVDIIVQQGTEGNLVTIDSFTTGLTSGNFNLNGLNLALFPGGANTWTNPILIEDKNYSSNNLELKITIKPTTMIINQDLNSNTITIRHNNLSLNINDNIIIDKLTSSKKDKTSTCTYSMIDPSTTLSIQNISSNQMTVIAVNGSNPSGIYEDFNINDKLKIYTTIEDNIKIMPGNINSDIEGNYNFLISGRANILYGQYIYRIMTRENNLAPIYTLGWKPKRFFNDVPMYVSKPLTIIDSTVNWGSNSNSWTVTLSIRGGVLPVLSQNMIVKIDRSGLGQWNFCGFNRYPTGLDKDTYDPVTDITTIILSSTNAVSWSSSSINAFDILVYDDTGSDTITINRQQ